MEFTHLHGHSTFSFLEAIGTPKKIIQKAKELGFENIALTDLGGMYGAIAFYDSARENGINPIIGTELGFVLDINGYNKIEDVGNMCLLAKNGEGYSSLMKIVSHANQEGISGKAKFDIKTLEENNQGLIAFMGGEESWIGKMIFRSEADEKIIEIINMIQDKIGKENVFLEIIAQDELKNQNLKKINSKIIELAEKLGIKCIVNNIYQYINESDKEAWEMALAIKDGNKMYDDHRRKPKEKYHLMSGQEVFAMMIDNGYSEEQTKNWINNNNEIAKTIKIEIPMGQTLFPNYSTPPHILELYGKVKNKLISN
ncbi:MAG TPA: PHP domain-containing protein [Candidatus Absconditabacterales bacterium]|nr:PHP domain-containing protein [Candidatus Absconditabacterales bacterium]